jgi:SAM-dependent methyltransferase
MAAAPASPPATGEQLMLWYLCFLIIACFTLVVFFGAPYLPTLGKQVEVALDLLDLQPGETMLELGCGDGKVVLAAARRGWRVVGYELNPILVVIAWLRTRRYHRQVTIVWGNFFRRTLPPADGIFCFILPRFMPVIHQKILAARAQSAAQNQDQDQGQNSSQQHDRSKSDRFKAKPLKLASFAFAITELKPVKYDEGVFLYKYK